jgi:hypothetical protein
MRRRILSRVPSALGVTSLALAVAIAGGCDNIERKPADKTSSEELFVQLLRPGEPLAVVDLPRFRFEATYEGAFSPDGVLLAAPVMTAGRRRQVALIDVDAGVARVIAGSKLAGYRDMAWSSSGRWL